MAIFLQTSKDRVSEVNSYHEGPLHKPAVDHDCHPKRRLHGPDLQHQLQHVPERHVFLDMLIANLHAFQN